MSQKAFKEVAVTNALPGFELSRNDAIKKAIAVRFEEKIRKAILLLKEYEPEEGYVLCFSGGKDSVVIKAIAIAAGVNFKSVYNQTTIDPPELVRFIQKYHADVAWNRPGKNLVFKMLEKTSGPPTRRSRWCCEIYKERNNAGVKIIGVRAAESPKRSALWNTLNLKNAALDVIAPVLYWSDNDVWRFIREQKLPYCRLYDEGFKRLGCVGCPMSGPGQMKKEFVRWPGFERLWQIGFRLFWEKYAGTVNRYGKSRWFNRFKSWQEMWAWWLIENSEPDDCQGRLF